MRRIHTFALLAAVPLAVPLAVAVVVAAPAHAGSVHYDCMNVTYFPMLVTRPVLGSGCTGPATSGAGTVTRTTDGVTYACPNLVLQTTNGVTLLHGQNCAQLF
jgi:hypothetical protein